MPDFMKTYSDLFLKSGIMEKVLPRKLSTPADLV
jgi:hypothetical protein